MSKIKVKSKISGKNTQTVLTNCLGIKKDNLITYKGNDALVNILITNDTITIKRENSLKQIKLLFKANEKCFGTYFIKDLYMDINIFTKTKYIKKFDNKLIINYQLYMNDVYSDEFVYSLEWSDL